MDKYKVIKSFFKLSEQKGYNFGDEIELDTESAKQFVKDGLVADIENKNGAPKTEKKK